MSNMASKNKAISEWFDQKYVQWRAQQKEKRAGIIDFANYLGVSRSTLNSWMLRGVKPEGDNLRLIGEKYPDLYDLLGLVRPNPVIEKIMKTVTRIASEDDLLAALAFIEKLERRQQGNGERRDEEQTRRSGTGPLGKVRNS